MSYAECSIPVGRVALSVKLCDDKVILKAIQFSPSGHFACKSLGLREYALAFQIDIIVHQDASWASYLSF